MANHNECGACSIEIVSGGQLTGTLEDFNRQIVKMALEAYPTPREAAHALGMGEKTMCRWIEVLQQDR